MAETKTKPTDVPVADYLAAIAEPERRRDCEQLTTLLGKLTRQPPVMWGPSIVGFGSYHYKYDSGHEGDACLAGFSSRKGDIAVYIVAGFEGREALLAKLGKHKTGKVCLYIKRLADVDTAVLGELVKGSVAEMKKRYA